MSKLIKAVRCLRNPLLRHALIRHFVAGTVEHMKLLTKLDPSLVLDVGANRGQFALSALAALPSASVISFEPFGPAAVKYRQTLGRYTRARLFEVALSPTAGALELHVSNRDDSSSLLPITENQTRVFPRTEEVGIVQVSAGPLSEYVQRAELVGRVLLKIDVQGFELSVLVACESLLDCITYVYVECSFVELYKGQALFGDVFAYLSAHGFQLRGIRNLYTDDSDTSIQADFLFVRLTRLASS